LAEYSGEGDDPLLIPARMLNEFAYCPRLCYIEWVQGEFVDSSDTADGRFQHRRVDSDSGAVPDGYEEVQETFHARSVSLTGPETGVACRIDLLEGEGSKVTPVDYKRGSAPKVAEGAYEPERVQLCAQGLVLRENGFDCDEGVIYFAKSKERVTIPFDEALVRRTKELIEDLRGVTQQEGMPPPLDGEPKVRPVLSRRDMPPGRGPPLKGDRGGGEGKGWGREKAGADKGRSAPDLRRRPGRDGSEAWRSAGVLVKGWQGGRCQAPGGGPALPLRRRGDHIASSRRDFSSEVSQYATSLSAAGFTGYLRGRSTRTWS